MADLRAAPEAVLRRLFGDGVEGVLAMARGEDDSRVEAVGERRRRATRSRRPSPRTSRISRRWKRIAKGIRRVGPKLREDGKCARTLTVRSGTRGWRTRRPGAAPAGERSSGISIRCSRRCCGRRGSDGGSALVSVRLSQVEDPARQLELFGGEEADRRQTRGGRRCAAESPRPLGGHSRAPASPGCSGRGAGAVRITPGRSDSRGAGNSRLFWRRDDGDALGPTDCVGGCVPASRRALPAGWGRG